MWDLKKRPVTAERHPGTPPVRSVAFSQDGGTLASSGDGPTVLLWEVKTRRRLATLTGHGCCAVNSAIFHPDGHTLVSAGEDKQLRVWDLRTRRPIARIASGSDVRDMAFSPDGEVLATVGSELRLWDFDGRHLKLRRFPARVSSAAVAISPDGKTIAIASGSAVMLRDLRSGRELGLPLASHTDSVTDVAFSPDGKTLATGSHDKAVRLWDSILWSDGRRLRDHICRAVGHSLDRTQWAELAPGLPYRETCPRP